MNQVDAQKVNGFPGTASFIASDEDKTTLVFRRFDRTAARNLLHLQAEVARLERLLDQLDLRDVSDMATLQYLRNWDQFREAAEHDVKQQERLQVCTQLEKAMKRYS
jgi:hypothetical protein